VAKKDFKGIIQARQLNAIFSVICYQLINFTRSLQTAKDNAG